MELAQSAQPETVEALKSIVKNPKTPAGYRVQAAKELRENASPKHQPASAEKFTISINLGTWQKPLEIEVADPQPKRPPDAPELEYRRESGVTDAEVLSDKDEENS
jgi:hypothetical protein